MKKLFVVMILILFFIPTFVLADSARITWKQPVADLPSTKEWIVYVGDAANPTTELTRIPYDGSGAASYTSGIPITVTGTPGSKVKKYLSLAAVSKNGNTSAKVAGKTVAGVDYLEFTVPFGEVSVPFDVIIEVVPTL